MCGLKRYTDGECGHTGQPSAASEQSSLTRVVKYPPPRRAQPLLLLSRSNPPH